MSLTPWVARELGDIWDPFREVDDYFSRMYDQNFGIGLLNDDLFRYRPSLNDLVTPLRSGYLRPFRHLLPEDSGISTVSNKRDKFEVSLDVQQFKPNEVNVKLVDDSLVIEGKHEEKQDKHGYVSRQFTRKYKLPKNVKVDQISSTISSDGILQISAPKQVEAVAGGERAIPITQTNKPALKQGEEKMET